MAAYGNNQQWNNQQQDFNFDMPEQFGQELNFQTFESNVNQQTAPQSYANVPAPAYSAPFFDPTAPIANNAMFDQPDANNKSYSGDSQFDDEPPLLEELGINPSHILQKTLSVLNPFRATDKAIFEDTDLAGPLVFCLAFGIFLVLQGKLSSFSFVYGICVMGCLSFYGLLTLMANVNVTLGAVISVLGYCMLPMVALSGINVLITIQGLLGTILTGFSILWCATSASKLFVTALSMDHQQILIAYPCALLYGVFALITVF